MPAKKSKTRSPAPKPKAKAAAPDRDLMGQFAKDSVQTGAAAQTRADGVMDLVDSGEAPKGPAAGKILDEDASTAIVDRDSLAYGKVSQKRRGADKRTPSARTKPAALPAPDPAKEVVVWSEFMAGCNKMLRESGSLWAASDTEVEQMGGLVDQVIKEAGFEASAKGALVAVGLLYAVPRVILVIKSKPWKKDSPPPVGEVGKVGKVGTLDAPGDAHPSDWPKLK